MTTPIRVTLSGSGFRFPAHVGALAAIEEAGYEIIELSGTSGGSIVAGLYASVKSASELKDITFNTDFSPMLSFNLGALADYSYCDGSKVLHFIQGLIGKSTTFSDLKIPLHVASSNIIDNSIHVFDKPLENVCLAIKASMAVPFIYSPVKLEGRWLVDGGICSNTPIELLQDDEVLKLGVRLISDIDTTTIKGPFDILCRSANLLFDSNDREHLEVGKLEKALFSIVSTGTIGSFNAKATLEERQFMYDAGYNKTKEVLAIHEHESRLKTKRNMTLSRHVNRKIYG